MIAGRILFSTSTIALIIVLAPFLGPYIGLADYQKLAEPPGRTVQIPNGTLNVYQAGAGEDLILIHGHPGSAQMMRPLAHALVAEGFRVTWYDRMGWGYSGQRPAAQPANPTAHAEDLLALVDALNLTNPLFVGYSYGGGVLMEANRLWPEMVNSMALIASVGPGQKRGPASGLQRLLSSPLFLRWAFSLEAITRQASASISESLVAPEQLPQSELGALLASFALPGVPTAWRREADERYLGFDDYQPARVHGCVLLIHGQDDRVVSLVTARLNAGAIDGAALVEVPGAGHAIVMTRPALLAAQIRAHAEDCRMAGGKEHAQVAAPAINQ